MKNTTQNIQRMRSVQELHRYMGLASPVNPLITLIDHKLPLPSPPVGTQTLLLDLYDISIKRDFKGQLRYGRQHYDFDNGSMSFIAPRQIITIDEAADRNQDGWSLLFHPDLIRTYPLGKAIRQYGFFSYAVNEALHLSAEEENTIESIVLRIKNEINARLDYFSQDVIVSSLELLFSYCNRYYSRQFISRKMASNDVLVNFEALLDNYFSENASATLPTVEKLAKALHVSPSYLSDMLRNLTGRNTQQHIHDKLIEKAKDILSSTELTVTEVAYQLGFDYPQSFSKLFKAKTSLTPVQYRQSFH